MTSLASRVYASAAAAAVWFAVCTPGPARAQAAPTVLQTATSPDGLLRLVLSSTNPSDAAGVNNTYTWTAINNSTTTTLTGVTLGSHWGDWCGGFNCTPAGPTLISAPGCSGQGPDEIPVDAHFGVWCTPFTGVTLLPGESVSGSVTLRPGAGGPPDYTVYSLYNDPKTGSSLLGASQIPFIRHSDVVAPAATDIQITGSASTGAPPAGSTFTYTYQVKNAGPWGTYGGITFVDDLPASLTFVSASVSPLSALKALACSVQGQVVTCPLNEMQNGGASGQATITLTVLASGPPQLVVNTASALTLLPQSDLNNANNSVTVAVIAR
ncbi:MAG TPA: DUF11 domain-containing protein [Bryobacteraceae bacterium]|nr:DUF11 domain-containing protein [Bryobacteraceae bacterium]